MYNLLITGKIDAWETSFYEFDRSRFLEYTTDEVASTFKSLGAAQIDKLKSLPCLFAYEGFSGNAKIGQITSIKERGRTLLIEYTFQPKTLPIPFSDIMPIAPLLDIREWEKHRTHWAVKDEDLIERLKSASLISADTKSTLIEKGEPSTSASELILKNSKIKTVKDFIAKVLEDKCPDDSEVFYRGHSDKKRYKLTPSLFRKDDQGNYIHLHHEHIIYRELIVSNSSDFSSDEYTLDRLIRMQHYSLPTRLLDITSNPLIALYFACKSKFGTWDGERYSGENEGEVIIITLKKEEIKYFDSDTASCIANLARLPKKEKDNIDLSVKDIEKFNSQMAVKRLTHLIREEKSFFEHRIEPAHLQKIICIKGKKNNGRIYSQSGAFLLFGLDSILDEDGTSDILVTRIPVENKAKILEELDLLNINESTVFPYIENSAKYVASKYSLNEKNIKQPKV